MRKSIPGFIDSEDYEISIHNDCYLFKISSLHWGYTITMNKHFHICSIESDLPSDDENPVEICECINSLVEFIKNFNSKH